MMKLLLLASAICGSLCLNVPLEALANDEPDFKAAVNASSCPSCVLVKGSASVQSVFPWLVNNNNARFLYARTDGDDPLFMNIFTTTNHTGSISMMKVYFMMDSM